MEIWKIFWLLVIMFSIVSFSYMSVKIIYKGFFELKDMLSEMNEKNENE